jgi:hypothetical protein
MMMIFGAVGGMKIGRGNRSTRSKPTPAPLCPPQNPTWQTRSRTPDRSCGNPAANRLSYGAAFFLLIPFRRLLRLAGSRWRYWPRLHTGSVRALERAVTVIDTVFRYRLIIVTHLPIELGKSTTIVCNVSSFICHLILSQYQNLSSWIYYVLTHLCIH